MNGAFRVGGLASGLDTQSIVDSLTDAQRAPIRRLENQRSAFEVQLSGVASLRSALEGLQDAVRSLGEDGVVGVGARSNPTGFSAAVSSSALSGRYDIRVDGLAAAAKARSQAFGAATDPVSGGELRLEIDGTAYDVPLADGATLNEVAAAINQSDAPVDAAVVDNGSGAFLTLTNRNTGFALGDTADSALVITETTTGSAGQPLGLSVIQQAANASFEIDGLAFERRSNEVSDALPGVTLSLSQRTTDPETLVLSQDVELTRERLQGFVDAYNSLNSLVEGDLSIGAEIDRTRGLGGDPALRALQRQLRSLLTFEVSSLGSGVRTLSDIGVESARDGTLSIDVGTLESALARNPAALNGLFSAADGLVGRVDSLVDVQVEADGVLGAREQGLRRSIDNLGLQITSYESRVERFRESLVAQFLAMEQIVSSLNSTSTFLDNLKLPGFTRESQ